MKKLLTLLFFFISCHIMTAQDRWTQFNTTNTGDNGIVGGYIYCFLNDANNKPLWIKNP